MTDVAIIVVNYGTGSQAVEAAISARASCRGNAKVVIVDNNSPSNGIDLVIKCLKDKDVPFYLHEDEKTKRENGLDDSGYPQPQLFSILQIFFFYY